MKDFPDGWWRGAVRRASPNFDARARGSTVDLLVVHAISLPPAEFGGPFVDRLFLNTLQEADHPGLEGLDGLRVSAHFFIRRTGETLQYVDVRARAWHAGISAFGGEEACNHRALGIELEGTDNHGFSDAQYEGLVGLSHALMTAFPALSVGRIVGHCDIAPGRKTDPGPHFDWVRYRAALIGAWTRGRTLRSAGVRSTPE